MNHLGDTNKMVGDTPRMDASAHDDGAIWQTGCDIERELNAASKERDDALMMLGMYRMKSDEQKQRIQRLEEAGDFLSHYLREMPYASSYLAQIDERILRINNWREAKEAKL